MTPHQLRAWRGVSRLGCILRLDEVLAIRPPPPRRTAKRPRGDELTRNRAPLTHAPKSRCAPKTYRSPQKPDSAPLSITRHRSGSGGVEKFFGREDTSRGHGIRGAPRSAPPSLGSIAPLVTEQHGVHRGSHRGDHGRGGVGGHRGPGYSGNDGWAHGNSSGRNRGFRWSQGTAFKPA
jgi:hypothetical protein